MLLTSLLGGQELASQLLNKGCRGDSEALLCWTHPKSWPRVDLGGQDRRRGGKLQGGLLLCTDLPSTAPSPAGRCWSRLAWPGGTGSGSQDCPHLDNLQWRLEDSGVTSFYLWRPHRPQMELPCHGSLRSSSRLDYLSARASVAKLLDNKT